jgi:hypothetical protein
VDNGATAEELKGLEIHQCLLGTCTNGRLEDLGAAARILQGRCVTSRLIVIPASAQVMLAATPIGAIIPNLCQVTLFIAATQDSSIIIIRLDINNRDFLLDTNNMS